MFLNRQTVFFALILALIGLTTALNPFVNCRPRGDGQCLYEYGCYGCYLKCQMDKKLEKLNLSTEILKDFINCMDQADDEPCSYAMQMTICAVKTFPPLLVEFVKTSEEEQQPELTDEWTFGKEHPELFNELTSGEAEPPELTDEWTFGKEHPELFNELTSGEEEQPENTNEWTEGEEEQPEHTDEWTLGKAHPELFNESNEKEEEQHELTDEWTLGEEQPELTNELTSGEEDQPELTDEWTFGKAHPELFNELTKGEE